MATTRLWPVKSRLDHLVDYVENPFKTVCDYVIQDEKTIDKKYVSYINVPFDNPKKCMETTKKLYHDVSYILAFHGYQSFAEDEVDADLAHQIGVEYANKMWGERFEVIVSTHLDTDNIHNHFLINSTSFKDGKRYSNTYNDIQRMRNISDELCIQYGLSVIEQRQNVGRSRKQYFHEKTLREIIREDVDYAISVSYTDIQFKNELELLGYEYKRTENNISLRHPAHSKFIRLKSLGDDYQLNKIYDRILDFDKTKSLNRNVYSRQNFDIQPYYNLYKQRRLTGLQRLFLHYQFLLKIIPRNNRSSIRPEYRKEMQEAIKKLDELSQQTIILCKNNISTFDELTVHTNKLSNQLKSLETKQRKYRNDTRKCNDADEKDELKLKARELTPAIVKLRKEIAYCKKIEERSLTISKFIDEKERKGRSRERN